MPALWRIGRSACRARDEATAPQHFGKVVSEFATKICQQHCSGDHIHLGPPLELKSMRKLCDRRPQNFDESVGFEKRLIASRGYVEALVDTGGGGKKEVKIYVSGHRAKAPTNAGTEENGTGTEANSADAA